jgi:DNA-binding transcriptional ArsR family regulator
MLHFHVVLATISSNSRRVLLVPEEHAERELEPHTVENLMREVRRELSEIRREQVRLREHGVAPVIAQHEISSDLMFKFSRRVKVLTSRIAERDLTALASRDIRDSEAIAKFMGALGNEERIRILAALDNGPMSFNDLEKIIEKKGGTLKYHLNQLESTGYVSQEQNRGRYAVTVDGMLAYRLSVWLTSCLSPTERAEG